MMDRAKQEMKALSVILIDVDDLKKINDEHGYPSGDRVLGDLGRFLREIGRERDHVFRYKIGDEFAILTLGTEGTNARLFADRVRREVQDMHFQVGPSQIVRVTISAGVTQVDPLDEPLDTLMSVVEEALRQGKTIGKNKALLAPRDVARP